MTVVVAVALSLAAFTSPVSVTEAVLLSVPDLLGGVTSIVTVKDAPGASAAVLQVIVPFFAVQVAPLAETLLSLACAGSGSVSVTFVAAVSLRRSWP